MPVPIPVPAHSVTGCAAGSLATANTLNWSCGILRLPGGTTTNAHSREESVHLPANALSSPSNACRGRCLRCECRAPRFGQ